MKLLKALFIIILAVLIGTIWYRQSYPQKWERVVYPLEFKDSIQTASEKYEIDPYLVSAIIYVESKFNPTSESHVGAIGLMQVMPDTGVWVAEKQGKRLDPTELDEPATNIDIGCWYFDYLRTKYGDEKLALAAYNSGDKNVDRWLRNSTSSSVDDLIVNIPYRETRDFVQRVERAHKIYKRIYGGEFSTVVIDKRGMVGINQHK